MEGGREPARLPPREPPGDCMRAERRISSSRRAASRSLSRLALTYSVGSKRPAEEGREPGRDTSADRDRGGGPAARAEQKHRQHPARQQPSGVIDGG